VKISSGDQPQTGWLVPTLPAWLEEASKAPTWIIPGLILDGASIVVSGQKKRAGKTYFAMTTAIGLAAGVKFGIWSPTEKMPVLFVEQEAPKKPTANRILAVCKSLGVDHRELTNIHFAHRQGIKLNDNAWRAKLLAKIKETGARLCVLDAMGYMIRGSENDTDVLQEVKDTTDAIQNLGCSTMALYHLDKIRGEDPKADIDTQIRGSGVSTDQYDTHVALRKYDRHAPITDCSLLFKDFEPKRFNIRWRFINDPLTGDVQQADMLIEDPQQTQKTLIAECMRRLVTDKKYTQVTLQHLWGLPQKKAKLMTEELESIRVLTQKDGGWWLEAITAQDIKVI
jgi:hypothetical protein